MINIKGGFLKAEQVYNRSKCNGIFTSQALAEILSSPNFAELLEATKRGVDNLGQPDPVLTKVLQEIGFTALPIMVDSNHYQLLVKSGLTPVYRGVKRDNAIVDFATNPELFVGKGLLCNGVHFVYDDGTKSSNGNTPLEMAARYARKPPKGLHEKIDADMQHYNEGQIVRALISENAKAIEIKELLKLAKMVTESIKSNNTISESTKQKMIKLFSKEASVIAALEGIDVIVAERTRFLIGLNRGVFIMDKGMVDAELNK